jgi:HPt (histidine-containing phosphotransfer) domain-containing protein
LEQAEKALRAGTLSDALRQQATCEAHTLVGSLGSFGLAEASRLSREIEQTFQAEVRLSRTRVERLSEMVMALRQELGQPPVILPPQAPRSWSVNQPRLLIVDQDAALAEHLIWEATARGMRALAAVTYLKPERRSLTLNQMSCYWIFASRLGRKRFRAVSGIGNISATCICGGIYRC